MIQSSMRLSADEFVEVVEQALVTIPPAFEPYLQDVVVDVEDYPDRETVRTLGLASRYQLLGLYRGVPLTARSVEHSGQLPDRITIYQGNIERYCRTRDAMIEQIRRTVLHEVGHHFGLDEDDLDALGYG
jgi:predicted Zn-dependent protease with MMP-like domain